MGSPSTFCRWRSKYGGMTCQKRDGGRIWVENRKLKQLLAEAHPGQCGAEGVVTKTGKARAAEASRGLSGGVVSNLLDVTIGDAKISLEGGCCLNLYTDLAN